MCVCVLGGCVVADNYRGSPVEINTVEREEAVDITTIERFVPNWLDEGRAARAIANIRKCHIDAIKAEILELRLMLAQ